jgi:hypothetical protein
LVCESQAVGAPGEISAAGARVVLIYGHFQCRAGAGVTAAGLREEPPDALMVRGGLTCSSAHLRVCWHTGRDGLMVVQPKLVEPCSGTSAVSAEVYARMFGQLCAAQRPRILWKEMPGCGSATAGSALCLSSGRPTPPVLSWDGGGLPVHGYLSGPEGRGPDVHRLYRAS